MCRCLLLHPPPPCSLFRLVQVHDGCLLLQLELADRQHCRR